MIKTNKQKKTPQQNEKLLYKKDLFQTEWLREHFPRRGEWRRAWQLPQNTTQAGNQSTGNTHSMCPISRAGRGTLTPVLCCGNGLGLTAREGTAPCAATHHFSLSRMRSTSLSVLSSEMQPDGKFRAFVYPNGHRSQESSQQRITVTEPFHSYWSSILQLSKVIAASGVGKRCSFRDAGSLQLPSALNLALLPPRYGLGEKVCWLGVFFLLQNLSGLRKFFPTLNLL